MSKQKVRRLTADDSKYIASLHHRTFQNFFLTSLGKPFLNSFYKTLLGHPDGFGFGLYHNETLIGFAVGSKCMSGFYRALIKRGGISMALSALPRLILAPSKLQRLVVSFSSSNSSSYAHLPSLLSICVDPGSKSSGRGKFLLSTFEQELMRNNKTEVTLTTDAMDNEYVNTFYIRNNYDCISTFYQGERKMNVYYKKLNP